MVVCPTDHSLQADIIFAIEVTAINGAYINDIKTNYIIPSLEYFNQGSFEEANYFTESANTLYGIVLYHAADCLPHPSTDTIGPFTSPTKVLNSIDKLELFGGRGESHANVAEGLATALQCFEELTQKREPNSNIQKHCLLICNSPPYLMPVMESQQYAGKTAEQLAATLAENNINLSILSPRKIPTLYKLFEKAGGDLVTSQSKNYAKDPRHLVLLKGYSLKERPLSPPPGNVASTQSQLPNTTISITSLPSPLAGSDSPISGSAQAGNNMMGAGNQQGVINQQGVGQNQVYRPPSVGINPIQSQANMVNPGMVGMVNNRPAMMPGMSPNMMNQPANYMPGQAIGQRPPVRWQNMAPGWPQGAQRPFMPNNQQPNQNQGSALLAQLNQPPSSNSSSGVGQFIQINTNSPLGNQQQANQHQQNQIKMIQNQPGMPTAPQVSNINMPQVSQPNQQAVTSQAQAVPTQNPPQMGTSSNRITIWQGLLEWIEKPKNAGDQPKLTKHVPVQVTANTKDGEPELKADGWPPKLIMQLMPKQLIGNIGGMYLKNSKSVLFHPTNCEALDSLAKVMSSGFAGCVHFTSIQNQACDIKVLILLYTPEKRCYLGFIPNDQGAFVDRLRKVIQQQKQSQMRQSQGAAGPNINPQTGSPMPIGTPPQMGANPATSQPGQQGMMMAQTNPIAMGGGQITQNVVSSTGQQNVPFKAVQGVMGQNVPGSNMAPRMPVAGMQNIQQGMNQSPQPGNTNMNPNMMGNQVQRAACENQLQAERQHNLEKINQLKQTLEAAQQQEQQYKSQLERISHMKTTQLQEALQIAQQAEMQYKMMDQQRMANQSGNLQQPVNPQQPNQQRTMRPVMSSNPGLRHLLQQQPQYRQQLMGMQQQIAGNGPRPQQMGQQMPNQGATQNTFDDGTFDFM